MARPRRLRIVDYPFHVIVRGTNQQSIFRGEGDRIFLHRTLADAAAGHGVAIHAYVFMTNHLHLLATGARPESISMAIQALGRRYVRYFNFLHGRSGTLWQGRFRSSVVDTDRYFLTCQRYIELNPVRAGICQRAVEFPWSSHRHYARGVGDDLVTPHAIHGNYRSAQYSALFDRPMPAEDLEIIRDSLNHGLALGDDAFRVRLAAATDCRTERYRRGRRPTTPPGQPELT